MSAKLLNSSTHFDSGAKIWRGPKKAMETGPDASLGKSILESMLKEPDHVAQICDNNSMEYTNKDIALLSVRIAQHLEEMGLQQEDVIGICASNTDYIAPLVLGALLCGTTLSALDPSFDRDGIRHIFSITKPKVMFCDGKVYGKVQASLAELGLSIPIYTMKDHLNGVSRIQELISVTEKENFFNAKPLKLGLQQTAAILCSSGSTGLPKGVCVSHGSLLNAITFDISPDGKLLCFSTLYWISGLLCLLQGTLSGCTRVITDQAYSPELFLRIVEQYKINFLFTPPSQMALAIQSPDIKCRDLSSLEWYLCGGSAVPFVVVQSFLKYAKDCKIFSSYGMSEVSGACCLGLPTKAGDNGQLLPNFEVKIVDRLGNNLGVCERGEVCIKQPFQWAGYYGDQKATDAIYDKDGWIRSGDIGYFNEHGALFIFDRKKEILKYNNFHINPSEIEETILQLPDVVEACVCGIPDIISSYVPAAAVVKTSNSKLTEAEVINYVAKKMAHFKQLRGGVYFLDSLPKTASGKNIRGKVTKIIETLFEERKECRSVDVQYRIPQMKERTNAKERKLDFVDLSPKISSFPLD